MKLRHIIYQRTHRGKRGFTFDVVEHQRMINPQNNRTLLMMAKKA